MSELDFYTVTVFQTNRQDEPPEQRLVNNKLIDSVKLIEEYRNMISARIIKVSMMNCIHTEVDLYDCSIH